MRPCVTLTRMKFRFVLIASTAPLALNAQTAPSSSSESDIVAMPLLHVDSYAAANDTPSAGFATTVTALRFEPSVDIQSRGFAETQSDIVIRGGTFQNTSIKVGAVNLSDPQTGHYFSEIPIDPLMLSTPQVLTGVDNAVSGLNSTVGTVAYNFVPLSNSGTLEGGVGDYNLYFSRLVSAWKSADNFVAGRSLGLQTAAAYSRGDGTIDNAGHRFQRFGLRLELAGQGGQTDLYAGYQKKDYGWPGMYTANASYDEGENYEVAIAILNHTQNYGEGSQWSVGAYARQLLDDYDLRRSDPAFYRPYQHETRVSGLAAEGTHNFGCGWNLEWRSEVQADTIRSTDLTYGNFMTRTYVKDALVLGRRIAFAKGYLLLQSGATYEDTNRDDSGTGPLARITYSAPGLGGNWELYSEFSRASQVAGYTALNSKPGLGSFSGDAFLPRERADNYELGTGWECGPVKLGTSVFYRRHYDLADWVYDSHMVKTFRVVAPMDMDVVGTDSYVRWEPSRDLSLSVGYAYLDSTPDYHSANVDASFYAMNYPRHRGTASLVWAFVENFELRVDAEGRIQEKNVRRTSGNDALFVNASLGWTPVFAKGLEFSVLVDNLTDCDFQDFPGSPADGRQYAFRTSYTW